MKNDKDLTEAEEIQKRWQEFTEEWYEKGLNNLDNHDGVVINLELDILEYEVKWALGSITTNKVIRGQLSYLNPKVDAVKVLHSICQHIWKIQQWPQDWKKSLFILIPKKGSSRECSSYCTIAFITHASKELFKILQVRLQQYMNQEFQVYKLDLKQAEEPESSCQHSLGHRKSKGIPEKISTSASLTMLKPLTVQITTNCEKFLKGWEYQNTLPASLKLVCMSRSNSQNQTWSNRLAQNLERSTSRLYVVTLLM